MEVERQNLCEKWGLTYFDLCAIIEVANELKGRS